jgi:hypothetical protein
MVGPGVCGGLWRYEVIVSLASASASHPATRQAICFIRP